MGGQVDLGLVTWWYLPAKLLMLTNADLRMSLTPKKYPETQEPTEEPEIKCQTAERLSLVKNLNSANPRELKYCLGLEQEY